MKSKTNSLQVKCALCGDTSHPTRDCTQKPAEGANPANEKEMDLDYMSFMAELDGKKVNTLNCPSGSFVIGACTSGRDRDCNNGAHSHSLLCSTTSPRFFESGSEGGWIARDVSSAGSRQAWVFCDGGQAISSRCAGGGDEDCSIGINPNYDHGIRCSRLSQDYYLIAEETWVCSDHGQRGRCPSSYVAVASCASGEHNDCDWSGCSGKETYTGLKCLKFGLAG
jgi:hypothetical protein